MADLAENLLKYTSSAELIKIQPFQEEWAMMAESNSRLIIEAATGLTKTGIIGIKVAIMGPNAKIYDKIEIDQEEGLLGVTHASW